MNLSNEKVTYDMLYEWDPSKMLEVTLEKPDDFLKVKETLTRMGISSWKPDPVTNKNVLTQSCHLLHKKGKYYIVHFKELFLLDMRESDLTISDVERRNLIALLLQQWGLLKIVVKENSYRAVAPISSIRVVSFKDKENWTLKAKYRIGTKY